MIKKELKNMNDKMKALEEAMKEMREAIQDVAKAGLNVTDIYKQFRNASVEVGVMQIQIEVKTKETLEYGKNIDGKISSVIDCR